jgi:hypothetical protein
MLLQLRVAAKHRRRVITTLPVSSKQDRSLSLFKKATFGVSVIKKVHPEGSVFSKKSRYINGYAVFSFSSISSTTSFGFLNLPFWKRFSNSSGGNLLIKPTPL